MTENSSGILPYVLSVAEKYDSMIYVLHVVEDFSKWGGFYGSLSLLDEFQTEVIGAAEKAMDSVCEEQLENYPNFQRLLVFGDPATEILKTI